MNTRSVLLCSGGADSITLSYWMREKGLEVVPLFINYGQHCVKTELHAIKQNLPNEFLENLVEIDLTGVYAQSKSWLIKEADLWVDNVRKEDMYLPYRNLLFLTVGSAYAQSVGIKTVYSAFINSNHATEIDCSKQFFNNLSKLLVETGAVDILMPFRDLTKKDVLKVGIKLGVKIGSTYSCQISSELPCGACPNCVDRLNAIAEIHAEK